MAKRGAKGPNAGTIKKGERRNPTGSNGRKKQIKAIREQLEQIGAMLQNSNGTSKTKIEWMLDAWFFHATKGNAAYAQLVASYLWGKPVERHEVTGAEGRPLLGLTDEMAEKMKAVVLGVVAKNEDGEK
jgi:hypothetical protein